MSEEVEMKWDKSRSIYFVLSVCTAFVLSVAQVFAAGNSANLGNLSNLGIRVQVNPKTNIVQFSSRKKLSSRCIAASGSGISYRYNEDDQQHQIRVELADECLQPKKSSEQITAEINKLKTRAESCQASIVSLWQYTGCSDRDLRLKQEAIDKIKALEEEELDKGISANAFLIGLLETSGLKMGETPSDRIPANAFLLNDKSGSVALVSIDKTGAEIAKVISKRGKDIKITSTTEIAEKRLKEEQEQLEKEQAEAEELARIEQIDLEIKRLRAKRDEQEAVIAKLKELADGCRAAVDTASVDNVLYFFGDLVSDPAILKSTDPEDLIQTEEKLRQRKQTLSVAEKMKELRRANNIDEVIDLVAEIRQMTGDENGKHMRIAFDKINEFVSAASDRSLDRLTRKAMRFFKRNGIETADIEQTYVDRRIAAVAGEAKSEGSSPEQRIRVLRKAADRISSTLGRDNAHAEEQIALLFGESAEVDLSKGDIKGAMKVVSAGKRFSRKVSVADSAFCKKGGRCTLADVHSGHIKERVKNAVQKDTKKTAEIIVQQAKQCAAAYKTPQMPMVHYAYTNVMAARMAQFVMHDKRTHAMKCMQAANEKLAKLDEGTQDLLGSAQNFFGSMGGELNQMRASNMEKIQAAMAQHLSPKNPSNARGLASATGLAKMMNPYAYRQGVQQAYYYYGQQAQQQWQSYYQNLYYRSMSAGMGMQGLQGFSSTYNYSGNTSGNAQAGGNLWM